jgi:hypothetical protein
MKRLTKSGLANTLQIAAILIMFGYPGCSSDKVLKEPVPAFSIPPAANTAAQVKTNLLKPWKGQQKWILLIQRSAK